VGDGEGERDGVELGVSVGDGEGERDGDERVCDGVDVGDLLGEGAVQKEDPDGAVKPDAQLVQEEAPLPEYVFAEHDEQDVAVPPLEKEPGGHVVQLEPDTYLPPLHDTCVQPEAPELEVKPDAQLAHEVAPLLLEKVFAEHAVQVPPVYGL
jgi:hypothetical protein